MGGMMSVCGDGQTTGSEVCDQPFTAANCGDDCFKIESTECVNCINTASCTFFSCDTIGGNTPANSPAMGAPKSVVCRDLLDCIYDTNCAATGDILACYCGTGNCDLPHGQTGGPNGACAVEFERASESTSPVDIQDRLANTAYASGRVVQRVDCAVNTGACETVCGVIN
jgi:hypothetical protein